jgi:hypothetical protein
MEIGYGKIQQHRNEPSGHIKGRTFLEVLSDYQLLK